MGPFVLEFSSTTLLISLLIFIVRVVGMALDMVRIVLGMRNKHAIAWVLGFIEMIIYVLSINIVLKDVNNVLKVVAYAAGFATGGVVGMWIEGKLAIGYAHMIIITQLPGSELADTLRQNDFAVTEIPAEGKEGDVWLCDLTVRRKQVKEVEDLARSVDPDAFITVEDITPIRRGYWGSNRPSR
jgi:uncharacterized protein YebE (UPF0316 family)